MTKGYQKKPGLATGPLEILLLWLNQVKHTCWQLMPGQKTLTNLSPDTLQTQDKACYYQ